MRFRWACLYWFLWFVVIVMIIFSPTVFFNAKVPLFFYFFNHFVFFSGFWWLICSLLFLLFISFLGGGGSLAYIFGCDLISYNLILLSLWIFILMVLARESIFHLGYFSGIFSFCCYCSYYYIARSKRVCIAFVVVLYWYAQGLALK